MMVYSGARREQRTNLLVQKRNRWQNRWSSDTERAAWTKTLIRNLRPSVDRKHSQECPTWAPETQQAERIIGHVTPTTIVASTIENEGSWIAVQTMVRNIMGKKERDERSRHRANMQSELRME
ncbi:hypothetical protein Trydic_g5903 [Trypoxylus dichotomus]